MVKSRQQLESEKPDVTVTAKASVPLEEVPSSTSEYHRYSYKYRLRNRRRQRLAAIPVQFT